MKEQKNTVKKINGTWKIILFKGSCDIQGITGTNDMY